ncbi:hypothetical protein E8E11_004488 [Didymella keratinophila]|nr:hypothetical protein E8E11_004488 [Didymella keratinophila]
MEILGLGPEWLKTEEAKEILFGEIFDYDDCGPLGDRPVSTYYADALRRVAAGEVPPGDPPTIINEEEFLQALAEAEAQAQDEDFDDDEDFDESEDFDDDETHGD